MNTAHALGDLEERVLRQQPVTRADIERVFACADLIAVGAAGEQARRTLSDNRVTFGRVLSVAETLPAEVPSAGEIRVTATPANVDDARERVRRVRASAGRGVLTAYTLADLVRLVEGDLRRLSSLAAALRADGLDALAAVVVDDGSSDEDRVAQVRAVLAGGLAAWRVTVDRASDVAGRVDLIERVCELQQATGAVRAFAPLARFDPADTPSTGYDDVKTIAAARLRCRDIAAIQVDWALYGPKLAQVAITFGANDIDGVSPFDTRDLGPRRSPLEDITRQIRAAGGEPIERDGTYGGA